VAKIDASEAFTIPVQMMNAINLILVMIFACFLIMEGMRELASLVLRTLHRRSLFLFLFFKICDLIKMGSIVTVHLTIASYCPKIERTTPLWKLCARGLQYAH